jgi:DNA replication and repair protein RecF
MILEKISLTNFKNYKNCTLEFNPGLNFVYGGNGNGKTNLLEAISILSYTKSFLQNTDNNCISFGENYYETSGVFYNKVDSRSVVYCRYCNNDKELIRNDEKIKKFSSFLGEYPLVVLSPGDIRLTSGPPSERRRNFDLLIAQSSRMYLEDLRNYNKVLKQKNKLLKENLYSHKYSRAELLKMLEVWNDELCKYAVSVIIRRLDFIDNFKSYMSNSFSKLAIAGYEPVIGYESEFLPPEARRLSAGEIRSNISSVLSKKIDSEIRRGVSLAGPHRDNYVFEIVKDGVLFDLRTHASQGEHKTFISALKFSEFDYIKANTEHTLSGDPIFLLDDVFSELDVSRIERISSTIGSYGQVFITTTDYSHLALLKNSFGNNYSAFKIVNGNVENAG